MTRETKSAELESAFRSCQKTLQAMGDATRQHLLCAMLRNSDTAYRAVELAAMTHLSRPAVSHHIRILREAGILRAFRKGPYVYYHLDPDNAGMEQLHHLTCTILEAMRL